MSTVLRGYIRLLLVESRLKDVKKKYPTLNDKTVLRLAKEDPSQNNKYLMWMARVLAEEVATLDEIVSVVHEFHKNQKRLQEKDINKYSIEDLKQALDNLPKSKTQQKKEAKTKGAEIIYEDEYYLIIYPHTQEAVCHYGRGTKWCITDVEGGHFEGYQKENTIFYFVFDKKKPSDDPSHKIAVVVKRDWDNEIIEKEYYDAEDDQLSGYWVEDWIKELIVSDAESRETTGTSTLRIFKTEDTKAMKEQRFFRFYATLDNDKVIFESENLSELYPMFVERDQWNSRGTFNALVWGDEIWGYDYFYEGAREEWRWSKGAAMADMIDSKNEEDIRNLLINKYPEREEEIDEMDLREIFEDYDFEDDIKSDVLQAYADAQQTAQESQLHDDVINTLEERFDLTKGADKWLVGIRYDTFADVLEDTSTQVEFEDATPLSLEDIVGLFSEYMEGLELDLENIGGDVDEKAFNENLYIDL